MELEAATKGHLARRVSGAARQQGRRQVDFLDAPNSLPGAVTTQSLVAIGEGIRKAVLVPGMKVNLKGKMLLSLSALITLQNNGLHPKVTPVVGINLSQ